MSQNKHKGMLLRIRKSRTFKGISVCLALNLLFQVIQPTVSLALTEGPSQPEVQSFEPVGTTQMVDLFSGDFNYNIPLLNLPGPNGGYPINLAYHAGVSMDDEASWVGLGWNLNVGALVRNMRGLPDEFLSRADGNDDVDPNYDHINVKTDVKESYTLSASATFSTEVVGGNAFPDKALQISAYYNNFRGMGISLAPSLGLGENNDFSLGLSLDSENGLGINGNIGGSEEIESAHSLTYKYNGLGVSLGFDGDLSVDYSLRSDEIWIWTGVPLSFHSGISQTSSKMSSGLSFSNVSYSPHIGRDFNNINGSISINYGSSGVSFFDAMKGMSFAFNIQDYSNKDKKGRTVPVMGYDKQGAVVGSKFTRDFSRQNEGVANKESVMLAHTYGTYDSYMTSGQGLNGFFKPRRNDIGKHQDPHVDQSSVGLSAGFDWVSANNSLGSMQFSGEIGINVGWSSSSGWVGNSNPLNKDYRATKKYGIDENLYYQAHGESTIKLDSDLDYLGGLELAKVKLKPQNDDGLIGAKRAVDPSVTFNNGGKDLSERNVRNTLIHSFQNNEVELMGEFDIQYYDKPTASDLYNQPSVPLNREKRYDRNGDGTPDNNIGTHKAGFKVLNEAGSYYVYGLPAYNNKEVESIFSVDSDVKGYNENTILADAPLNSQTGDVDYKINGTHKFISKTTTSPYAHAYMLTSVQGADYVDVKNDGPTDDDLGYWVKFDYAKQSDDYQWRAPYDYDKAHFSQGQRYHNDDDKGSYKYGEKELWYLARIETKTHIAVFVTETRNDYKEALGELSGNGSTSNDDRGVKLKEVRLYEKANFSESAVPLQTVHFNYAPPGEQLCDETLNSDFGKLTLRSVHFTSLNSQRGELNKYEFDYAGLNLSQTGVNPDTEINPDYKENSYDGWGNYRSITSGTPYSFYSRFPYVNQFNQEWDDGIGYNTSTDLNETDQTRAKTQQIMDRRASAWCLNRIKLPSGGVINIDYESDDYGYVQHKTANQMFKITKIGEVGTEINELYDSNEANSGTFYDENSRSDEINRRIYFKLEYPYLGGSLQENADHVYGKYVQPIIQDEEGKRNLFFKVKTNLVPDHNGQNDVIDYVSGYLPLEEPRLDAILTDQEDFNYGVSADGKFGFVTIQATKKKKGDNHFGKYHPIALGAWTYLQTNAQELLHNPNSFSSEPNSTTWPGYIVDMVNFIPQLMSSFGAIRSYCYAKSFAHSIDLDQSCIRLASPDKRKFGGGHRVKQISISDEWNIDGSEPENNTYGQVFNYTKEEDGVEISSGVATFEPNAIGDENALRYPIYFYGKSSLFTRNNLFSEAPTNADLFPGPSVGYSRVTVKSLNTRDRQEEFKTNGYQGDFGRTGGVTVHEFYTHREFPVITSFTRLSEQHSTKDVFNVNLPIPFVGSVKRNYFHGTQAFLIETNDMHGKPKAVRTYELNNYKINSAPITESEYLYQADHITYQGEFVQKLNNAVNVIPSDNPKLLSYNELNVSDQNERLMGVDVELYTDQRQSKTFSSVMGGDFGFEQPTFWPGFPWPEFWLNYTNHKTLFRTFVTNKVVHRTGILQKTKSRDLQATNESEVLAYDDKSGVPIKVKTTNHFGDEIYSYSIPAHYQYERMGHAYQNIDFRTVVGAVEITQAPSGNGAYLKFIPGTGIFADVFSHLVRGDELLLTGAWYQRSGPYASLDNALFSSAVDGGHKKGYYLGAQYSNGNPTVGIIHFPEGVSINDIGDSWSDGESVHGSSLTEVFPELRVIRSGYRNQHSTAVASYTTKGDLSFATSDVSVTNPETGVVMTTPVLDDNVLAANASLFKDGWATSSSLDITSFDGTTENPFLTGNSGIWRPYKSYSYVGLRKGNADMNTNTNSDNPDLRNDGIMSDVPMFSWDIGKMEDYVPEWEWMSEVTRFSQDAYELESVNRIGIFSSGLYGYNNSLSIAVGGNASLHELGVYDFETAEQSSFDELLGQTNMLFAQNSGGAIMLTDQYPIRSAEMQAGNILKVTLDVDYSSSFSLASLENNVGVSLVSESHNGVVGNAGYYFNGTIDPNSGIVNNGGFVQFDVIPYIEDPSEPSNLLPVGGVYSGKVTTLESRSYASVPPLTFSDTKAHTGKRSLEVSAPLNFDQPSLKLINGKEYILSLWISKDDENVFTYEPGKQGNSSTENIQLTASFGSISVNKIGYSQMIEGWQKVDIELTATSDNVQLEVALVPGDGVLFVDDVRFSPKIGGITTSVYDPEHLWLRAMLNVDNYATLFYYDEQGNLTLKKQETEEGIHTVSESRAHVYEKSN